MKRFAGISYLLSVCLLALARPSTAQEATAQETAAKCTAFLKLDGKQLPNASTTITSAKPYGAAAGRGPVQAMPAHCEVLGKINERTGANGQHYSIQFRLRLPNSWNGNFFFQGGGGSNGVIGNALGNLQGQQRTTAMELGYAVVSQDAGHDNLVNSDSTRNGNQTFGFDPQARLDFGYNSYDQVTQAAKALIQIFYGRAPERSYFVGCSEGGREGMMMSQRFPAYFDGILACSPGFKLPKAAVFGEVFDTQVYAELAKTQGTFDKFGQPLLSKTFTDEDLDLAVQSVLAACDKLDGLEDGIIDNFPACTADLVKPKLAEITCKGPKRNTCLTAPQINALVKVIAGAKSSKGELLYADWAWDRGIGGKAGDAYYAGWRAWKLGAFDSPTNAGINATLGAGAVSAVFTTPPTPLAMTGGTPMAFMLGLDPERDGAKIYAESADFTQSAWNFMMASSTDLSAFKSRGGKMVIVHGVSDPIFSIKDTISWWTELNQKNNGAASDFVRLFAVPGMNHCAGGPATDEFDAFAALVNWVEKSSAPASIVAKAGPGSPWPGRTRPLCSWPAQARYKGSGSIEDAANFSCK